MATYTINNPKFGNVDAQTIKTPIANYDEIFRFDNPGGTIGIRKGNQVYNLDPDMYAQTYGIQRGLGNFGEFQGQIAQDFARRLGVDLGDLKTYNSADLVSAFGLPTSYGTKVGNISMFQDLNPQMGGDIVRGDPNAAPAEQYPGQFKGYTQGSPQSIAYGQQGQVLGAGMQTGTSANNSLPTDARSVLVQKVDQTDPNLSSNQAFVNAVFRAYMGRDANTQELQKYTGQTVDSVRSIVKTAAQNIMNANAARQQAQPATPPIPHNPNFNLDLPPQINSSDYTKALTNPTSQFDINNILKQMQDAYSQYNDALKPSVEERAVQAQLDQAEKDYLAQQFSVEGQSIPSNFIGQQMTRLNEYVNKLALPLEKKLQRLQDQRKTLVGALKEKIGFGSQLAQTAKALQELTQPDVLSTQVGDDGSVYAIVKQQDGTMALKNLGVINKTDKKYTETGTYTSASGEQVFWGMTKEGKIEQQTLGKKKTGDIGGLTKEQLAQLQNIQGNIRNDQDVKGYIDIRDSYNRVQASSQDPSGAGDLALIYNYMKMLDPGSVVRESEFATAAASGSLGERFKAAGEKILKGERLSNDMRADFVDRSNKLYQQKFQSYQKAVDFYGNQLDTFGIPRALGLRDFVSGAADSHSDSISSRIQEARDSGWSYTEIIEYLRGTPELKTQIDEAAINGYKPEEIINFLKGFSGVGSDTNKAPVVGNYQGLPMYDTYSSNPGTNRSDRNNNPGNIKASNYSMGFNGVIGVEAKQADDGGYFLVFNSPQDGANAVGRLLQEGKAYKGVTAEQAIKKYNGGGSYGAIDLGLNPNQDFQSQIRDPQKLSMVVNKLLINEGYTGLKSYA